MPLPKTKAGKTKAAAKGTEGNTQTVTVYEYVNSDLRGPFGKGVHLFGRAGRRNCSQT